MDGIIAMGNKMIGISAKFLHDKDRKAVLATAWSIIKSHYKILIGGKTEKDLVEWANSQVGDKEPHIANLSDKANLKTCRYWLALIASIEPKGIDQELITAGDNKKMLNKMQDMPFLLLDLL